MLLRACLLLRLLVTLCDGSSPIQPRIVGGAPTTIAQIPYQIALYVNNQFTCGGSLITRSCVLTAAHCVAGRAASTLKVRAGITQLSSISGETRTVLQTHLPDKFNPRALEMDVAILKLNAPLGGTNIGTIELSNKQVNVGDHLQISGWGFTSENASAVSNQLRVVTVEAISKAQCMKAYPGELTETMFCAGARGGGKDSCSGDSGGPAVKSGQQMGIVSWGNGCARAEYPGVYTSVKHILPWINRVKVMHCGTK